jgi:hypothetical protein
MGSPVRNRRQRTPFRRLRRNQRRDEGVIVEDVIIEESFSFGLTRPIAS